MSQHITPYHILERNNKPYHHYSLPNPINPYTIPSYLATSRHYRSHPIATHPITSHPTLSHHLTCIVDVSLSQALQLIQQPSQVDYHSVAHHTVRLHIQYT
jgi:hypothetical protein